MNVFVYKEGEGVSTGWDEIEEAPPSVAAAVCLKHTHTHTHIRKCDAHRGIGPQCHCLDLTEMPLRAKL